LSPLAALTETWCEIEVPGIGPFDSSAPAVVVAELLVAQVASQLQEQARERIDRTEAMWKSTQTFHDSGD
jgi:DNA-binding MurR/RpiR family transcriptional regulator